MKPFQDCFTTPIDLSLVGVIHALEAWSKANGTHRPTILWIHRGDAEYASRIIQAIDLAGDIDLPNLMFSITPEYEDSQWSLGTLDDYGFGSKGI